MQRKPDRRGLAVKRVGVAAAIAAAVFAGTLAAGLGWTVALSLGWVAAAFVTSGWIWLRIAGMNAAETAANAQAEDYTRAAADLVLLNASLASLVAVGFTLVDARHHGGAQKGLLILLAIAVVALSWVTVQLVFTVRYGDLYYAEPAGGVDFNQAEPPDYRDFVYLAVTIGMTFQVSDTSISSKVLRRTAARHAILSFLFDVVIVALTINTVASLLQ
jgi:uncharacterized membrane protein